MQGCQNPKVCKQGQDGTSIGNCMYKVKCVLPQQTSPHPYICTSICTSLKDKGQSTCTCSCT